MGRKSAAEAQAMIGQAGAEPSSPPLKIRECHFHVGVGIVGEKSINVKKHVGATFELWAAGVLVRVPTRSPTLVPWGSISFVVFESEEAKPS